MHKSSVVIFVLVATICNSWSYKNTVLFGGSSSPPVPAVTEQENSYQQNYLLTPGASIPKEIGQRKNFEDFKKANVKN